MKKELVIFNLELNLDSLVLAAAHDWVVSFSNRFEKVSVYSTHVGRVLLPINVTVKEIGGGSFRKRVIAIIRLVRLTKLFWSKRQQVVVLHHMSTYSAVIIGPALRIFGIQQGLWYSHSVRSTSLRISSRIVNVIFSSNKEALPIETKKGKFIGHGIDFEKFAVLSNRSEKREGIVSVGRYAKIKKYEEFLSLAENYPEMKFVIYGPNEDEDYKSILQKNYQEKNSNIFLRNALLYKDLPNILNSFEYFFSGTPKSVDKAAIEAAMCGCFVISESPTTIDVTGMREVWNFMGVECPRAVADQLEILKTSTADRSEIRSKLIRAACERNSLDNLTLQIKSELLNCRGNNHE